MSQTLSNHGPSNPLVEAMDNQRTRVSWQGQSAPKLVEGLEVTYCKDGMMWLGPINTPVRYSRINRSEDGGQQILELHISLAGLRLLDVPCRDFFKPRLVVNHH